MKIYYRISDNGYNKLKPDYINNENCLDNFLNHFGDKKVNITLVCDNVKDDTYKIFKTKVEKYHIKGAMINKVVPETLTDIRTNEGSSAAGFRYCLNMALKDKTLKDEDVIYFVEGDYIHRKGSYEAIIDGLSTGADIISLYTHPDKFIPASKGGNPLVGDDGGQVTKVFQGKKAFWMLVDSTTCTWATKLKTLREIAPIIQPFISGTYPRDMEYFHELRRRGYSLIQPLPTFSSHAETAWLSPLVGLGKSDLPEIDRWGKILELNMKKKLYRIKKDGKYGSISVHLEDDGNWSVLSLYDNDQNFPIVPVSETVKNYILKDDLKTIAEELTEQEAAYWWSLELKK